MAYVTKNNRYINLKEGYYEARFVNYESHGKKVTRYKNVVNHGYLFFDLGEGVKMKQYSLLTSKRNHLFYRLLKATKADFDISEECKSFDFLSIKDKEVVIEVKHNFDGIDTYANVVNVYDIEDGRAIIEYVKQEDLGDEENNIYDEVI